MRSFKNDIGHGERGKSGWVAYLEQKAAKTEYFPTILHN